MPYTYSMNEYQGYKNKATMLVSKNFVPRIERMLNQRVSGQPLPEGAIRRHLLLASYELNKLPVIFQELLLVSWAEIDWDTLFAEARKNNEEKACTAE